MLTQSSLSIQIMTAAIAYDRGPSFERYAPGQLTTFDTLLGALDETDFTELRRPQPSPVEGDRITEHA